MTPLENHIQAFVKLGTFISQFTTKNPIKNPTVPFNDDFFDGFLQQLKLAEQHNGWFTQENLRFSLEQWSKALTTENLTKWLSKYSFKEQINPKKVAIVMAGNIPLVGFHDFLSVLISGHHVLVKQSSNDKQLLPIIAAYLQRAAPFFKGRISFTEDKLDGFDAVIATGSNNTARYFEYYFKSKPSIVRKNRNSVAVLTGKETQEQLEALGADIFTYYGLGCRSVSKLFVPKDYNFDAFFKAIYKHKDIINLKKYENNYDYNKAVYLMSQFQMLENGFFMIKEDTSYASPIATAFYEYYTDVHKLKEKLTKDRELIQCIVANGLLEDEIAFGQTQQPTLNDYADGVDTVDFLLKI